MLTPMCVGITIREVATMYSDKHVILADVSEQTEGQMTIFDMLRNQSSVSDISLGFHKIDGSDGSSLDSIKGAKLNFSDLVNYVGKTVIRVFSKFNLEDYEVCKILRVEDYYGKPQCLVQFRDDGAKDFIFADHVGKIEEIYDFC